MKIRIIGHAGSGKTTLSKEIAASYGYTAIPLDSFLREKDKRKRKYNLNKRMSEHESWVIEGVHEQKWCRDSFTEADFVIILDYPLYIVQYRVIKRTLQRRRKATKERKKFLKKRANSLLKWNRKFTQRMPRLKEKIYDYNSNTFVIRSPRDVERVKTIISFYI